MKCLTCVAEFESKRSSAKYCSAKCRKLAFQQVSVPQPNENAKSDQNVRLTDTVKSDTVRPKGPFPNRKEGYEYFYTEPGCSHCEGFDTCDRSYCPNFKGRKYYEKFSERTTHSV